MWFDCGLRFAAAEAAAVNSACTARGELESTSRPIICADWPFLSVVADGANTDRLQGIHTSGSSGAIVPLNAVGQTPTIVNGEPLRTTMRPMTDGSAPYRLRQNASLSIAAPAAPVRSSASEIVRPSDGCTPSVSQ